MAGWASRAALGTGTGGFYLGVDIGGTKTRVGLVGADHRVLEVREAPRRRGTAGVGPVASQSTRPHAG
jgi:predicted NBD/HSP70 family sugar kinase